VKALELVENVESDKHNDLKLVRCPITFSESQTKKMQAPPDLGEHRDEILENILGYEREKIKKMLSNNIIK
jgi:succinate--hydroxymethylglutarate CoA-transferase